MTTAQPTRSFVLLAVDTEDRIRELFPKLKEKTSETDHDVLIQPCATNPALVELVLVTTSGLLASVALSDSLTEFVGSWYQGLRRTPAGLTEEQAVASNEAWTLVKSARVDVERASETFQSMGLTWAAVLRSVRDTLTGLEDGRYD